MIESKNKSHSILCVDPEDAILDLYKRILCNYKNGETEPSLPSFEVTCCSKGNEAIEAVKLSLNENKPYAVAFIDISLQDEADGEWVVKEILKFDSNIFIIIVTGYRTPATFKNIQFANYSDKFLYLQKPFHPKEIIQFALSLSRRWLEVKQASKNTIIRSIEFPPEYHKAGISILHTFGDVLRKKYPDKQAKVRIEQEDLKVTMIIETEEGDREIIQEALNDYGLVVTGKMTPEKFTDDPSLILEIKNELNYSRARIESQRELIQFQQANINNLNNLLIQFIKRPSQPIEVNIPVSSSIDASIRQNINVEIAPQISLMHGGLNELKEQLKQGSEEAKSVEELQQSLDQIEHSKSKEEVSKSSAMSKLGRFLENVEKSETTAGKVIKTTKDGIEIARQLAGHYNDIAQWCGLPQVPEPFVKK